ncbi:uncharacterized protein LOC108857988 [Raphanus sativus]|uniref:Uncharacterized protein LOC108857988 n=1 Tax=Raphanus sativus TaxID=3726 RepID=A0A6J0NRU2_RAPSA|nr:uncharacterized protein LOC108857988 [Raphanus sativus]
MTRTSTARAAHSSYRQHDSSREHHENHQSRRSERRSQDRDNTNSGDLRRTLSRDNSRSSSHPHPPTRRPTAQWVDSGRRLPPPLTSGSHRSPSRTSSLPRERDRTLSPLRETRQEPPIERTTSDLPRSSMQYIAPEDIAKAQEELREFMNQYSNCADPIESATRKERVRLSEENGDFERTTINMAITNLVHRSDPTTPPSEPCQTTSDVNGEHQSLEVYAPSSTEQRPSALDRLGPVLPAPIVSIDSAPIKKRLGRPPGKSTQTSAKLGATSAIKKPRRTVQSKGSPKRRTPAARAPKPATGASKSSTRATPAPSTTIIPPVAKRSMDFRPPQSPIP